MALPVGVQTKTLSIGRPFDALGNYATLKITVTPVFGGTAQRLVWSATGETFEVLPVVPPAQTEPDGDTTETIDLPIVDQAGWLDGSGNAITGWSYQVSVTPTFTVGSTKTKMKTYTKFVSPKSTDASTIDMDTLFDGTAANPTIAAGPAVTSVAGVPGAVVSTADLTAALSGSLNSAVSPLDPAYGAVGNDTADDTTAVQLAATAAANFGLTLDLRGKTYKVTSTITPPANLSMRNGTLHLTTANTVLLGGTSDGVTLENMTLQGPQSATYRPAEKLLSIVGTATTPINGLTVRNVRFKDCGGFGLWGSHVDRIVVDNNQFENIHYAGAMFSSGRYGSFRNNRIKNILGTGSPGHNAYGVSFTREELDDLSVTPKSCDWVVTDNEFRDIPTWAGVDMHGGERITIADNKFYAVKTPIGIGETDNASNVTTWASHDINVAHNVMDSGVRDGTWPYAINVTGCLGSGVGTPGELSSGVKVIGNTIRGYGLEANILGCAILVRDTRGLVVASNTIVEPGYSGVNFSFDNYGFTCVGNTIVDPWSNTVGNGEAFGLIAKAGFNTGVMSANHTVRGSKTATYVATWCVGMLSATSTSVALGPNMGGASGTIKGSGGIAANNYGSAALTTTGAGAFGSVTTTGAGTFATSAVTGLLTAGSANVGVSAQGALTAISNGSTVGGYQIAARARAGGYGAGIRFETAGLTTDSTTYPQGAITVDGEAAWTDLASAISYMRFWTSVSGALVEQWRIKSNGDFLAVAGRSVKMPVGTGVVQTGHDVTANRPSASAAGAGAMWFDTTLHKPIWSTGTGWVDATGVTA